MCRHAYVTRLYHVWACKQPPDAQVLLPTTQLLVVLDGCPECLDAAAIYRHVAIHYGIPTVDYAALVRA